jgi:hypothetical protein
VRGYKMAAPIIEALQQEHSLTLEEDHSLLLQRLPPPLGGAAGGSSRNKKRNGMQDACD